MLRIFASALFLCLFSCSVFAQSAPTGMPVEGAVVNRATVNSSVTITTGGTFQQVLASVIGTQTQRQALTIQNNNTNSDNCRVFLGPTASATTANSILLSPGQSYTRYWPIVPSDAIQVTCATAGDSVYVDNQ
jgi:hypothetical protein